MATLMLLAGLVTPVAAAQPDAPTNVNATAVGQTVTVTFVAGDDQGATVSGFEVTLTPITGTPIQQTVAASPATFAAVPVGTYDATVIAQVGVGDDPSDPSAPDTVVVSTAPTAAPTGVGLALFGTNQLTVTWTPVGPAGNGGSPITGYQYSLDNGVTWLPSGAVIPGPSFNTPAQVPGTYRARVRAVNAVGEGPQSTPQSNLVTIAAPNTVPGAPTAVTASRVGQTSNVTVGWTAPVDDGGAAITRYEVRRDAGAWVNAALANPFQVAGLADGQPHTYQVRAVNPVGPSVASAASAPVTIPAPPVAPGAVTNLGVSNTGSTINVSWNAAPGGPDNYRVELTGPGADATNNVSGLNTSFPNRTSGTYTVTVTAELGALEGPGVSVNYTLTLQTSAPSNVNASVNEANTEVTVTWTPPPGDVAEYVVSLSPANADPQTVPAGEQSAAFSGLPGGNYTVSVVAVNAGGTSDPGSANFTVVVAPGAPRNVGTTAAVVVGAVTVTWEAPANNGNGTISGYKVVIQNEFGATVASAPESGGSPLAAAARQVTLSNLPIGKLTAVVVAVNAQGDSAPGSSPEFRSERPVHPFASEPAFANQVYRDLFNINPTAAEVGSVTATLTANGSNGPTIITNLMRSTRFEYQRQVSRLYFAYFLRVPDQAGQKYWASKMESGELDLQGVSDLFALSPEFRNTYGGLDEQQFLVVVYNNVLGRAADVGGFNYWLAERNKGLSRGGVMTWFTEGEEYKRLSLPAIDTSLAHIMLLDRAPGGGEYGLWVTRIRDEQNTTLETLVAAIYDSEEYGDRVTP